MACWVARQLCQCFRPLERTISAPRRGLALHLGTAACAVSGGAASASCSAGFQALASVASLCRAAVRGEGPPPHEDAVVEKPPSSECSGSHSLARCVQEAAGVCQVGTLRDARDWSGRASLDRTSGRGQIKRSGSFTGKRATWGKERERERARHPPHGALGHAAERASMLSPWDSRTASPLACCGFHVIVH